MLQIYKDRFHDASDFTFYLVGDIEREKTRELVAKYVGAIKEIFLCICYQFTSFCYQFTNLTGMEGVALQLSSMNKMIKILNSLVK